MSWLFSLPQFVSVSVCLVRRSVSASQLGKEHAASDEFVPGEVSRVAARIIDSDVTQLRPDPPRSSLLARQGEQQLCTIPTGKEEEEGGSEGETPMYKPAETCTLSIFATSSSSFGGSCNSTGRGDLATWSPSSGRSITQTRHITDGRKLRGRAATAARPPSRGSYYCGDRCFVYGHNSTPPPRASGRIGEE